MKKLVLSLLTFMLCYFGFAQNSVLLEHKVANYDNSLVAQGINGGTSASFTDNGSTGANAQATLLTNPDITSSVTAWRKLRVSGTNTSSTLRAMQIGDRFSVTVNTFYVPGEIGVSLLASPSTFTSYSDRANNYAVSVNLDGVDNTGFNTGQNFWYVRSKNGTSQYASFGADPASAQDFKIDFVLTASDRMNVTITNVFTPAQTVTFYDVQLNNSNPITDYSIYSSDAYDPNLYTPVPVIFKQETTINNTGSFNLGNSSSTFSVAGALTNGTLVTDGTTASINNLSKTGIGSITLQSSSTYTGTTSINAGSITLGVTNALPTGTAGNIILAGGNLRSGATSGYSLGSSGSPAGAIQLLNSSTDSLGTGAHSLYFANSAGLAWTAGQTWTIVGWVGTVAGGGTSGKIFVGNNTSGLTAQQLTQINFTGYGNGAKLLASGELVPQFDASPTLKASGINFTNLQFTSLTLNFTPGNGTGGRIVIVRQGSAPTSGPVNGTTYTANSQFGGPGASTIGNGSVVYATIGSATLTQSVTITGLTKGATYYFEIYEYNGSGASASYGTNTEAIQATPTTYITNADGTWDNSNTALWQCGCIPPSTAAVTINNNITLGINASVAGFYINSGKTFDDGGFTLTVTASPLQNNGTHNGAGKISIASTGPVAVVGSGQLQNLDVSSTGSGFAILTLNDITIKGTLTLTSNTFKINGKTLTVNGAISGSGTLTGSSTSNLALGAATSTINFNTSSAITRSLKNLSLNNTASNVTLGSNLDLYGLVTSTGNSVLNFNSKTVTLKSTASTNATIGPLPSGSANITNATNIIAERYIPASQRGYRTITSAGVNASGTIQANWQEGQMNTLVGSNVNTNPGYGTQISGAGGNTKGFDATQTNSPSLYKYNNGLRTYSAVTSTLTAGALNGTTPYLMYIRGDRSIDVTSQASPLPTSSTTLRVTGSLVTGDQDITSQLVGNSDGSSTNGYNLISNPFASYLDFNAISTAYPALATNYSYVDPSIGAQGGYINWSTINGGTVTPSVTLPKSVTSIIQPGQSFFIQFLGNAGSPVPVPSPFLIKEIFKSTTGQNSTVFKNQTATPVFRADIFFNNAGTRTVADGIAVVYDDQYSLKVDKYDTPERNLYEHIAIVRGNVKLQIEARPTLAVTVANPDTLYLYLSGMNVTTKNYELQLNASDFNLPGVKAELVDKFTSTRTPVSLTGTTNYPFVITSDDHSTHDRFFVVFSPLTSLPVTLTSVKAYKQNNGVQVEWNISQESNVDKYEIQYSQNSTDFTTIGTKVSNGNSTTPVTYNFLHATPATGNNYYRIKAIDKNGSFTLSQVVSVNFTSIGTKISVYPNPVIGNDVNIHIDNLEKGTYPIVINNQLGQVVYSKEFIHTGGSIVETIKLKNVLRPGIYELKVGSFTVKLLKQ